MKPELFDVIELLVNLPKHQQSIGAQGTIVECHDLKLLTRVNLMLQKILLAIGDSPESEKILASGLNLAEKFGSELLILHVLTPPMVLRP